MGENKNVRHRFTVPVGDINVRKWIEVQSNLGFSLRILIKAFIRDYGTQDATCLELGFPVKRVGRPPKKAEIHLSGFQESNENQGEIIQDEPLKQPVQAQASVLKPVNVAPLTQQQKLSQEALKQGGQVDMNNLGL